MKFDVMISDFARELQLEGLEPDENGAYTFIFDDKYTILCSPVDEDSCLLFATVSPSPKDKTRAEELYRRIIKFNLEHLKEIKAVISLNPDNKDIVLYQRIDLNELTVRQFKMIIESFVDYLEVWTDFVQEEPETRTSTLGWMQA